MSSILNETPYFYCLLIRAMLFKKVFVFSILLIVLLYSHANAQPTTVCTVIGQNPISAFPVCGSNVFSQTSVPLCGGKVIPVIPCKKDASPFTDINPFWYKFTCYKTGTLGFSIVPINRLDDYDWQLFDVTNDSADIYKDASLIVACNWSGRPGTTGTGDNGKNLFENWSV